MKVYNCFPFFNELDLLEIKLNEMYDAVDYFIIVEGEKTHQNKYKPLYYVENKERYERFADKIIHVVLDESNFTENSQYNEAISYDAFMHGLEQSDAQDDDIIILSDTDEIIKKEIITEVVNSYTRPVHIPVHNFCYYLNTQFTENDMFWWTGPAISYKELKQFDGKVRKCFEWGRNRSNSIPSSTVTNIPLPHGWHFSFMGNKTDVRAKVTSYIHAEWSHLTEEDFDYSIKNLLDPFKRTGGTSHKFAGLYPINQLPQYVQENIEKFNHLIRKEV